MTKIIITSILLALFSILALAQEEKPKLNANAGAARRLIIQYLIDHLDRCKVLPAVTPVEIEAADRCHAILTEKVNLLPLSVLNPLSHVTRETDANTAKMDALLNLYDAFLHGMEKGLKEGWTARKGFIARLSALPQASIATKQPRQTTHGKATHGKRTHGKRTHGKSTRRPRLKDSASATPLRSSERTAKVGSATIAFALISNGENNAKPSIENSGGTMAEVRYFSDDARWPQMTGYVGSATNGRDRRTEKREARQMAEVANMKKAQQTRQIAQIANMKKGAANETGAPFRSCLPRLRARRDSRFFEVVHEQPRR